jgi:hypothetical protein
VLEHGIFFACCPCRGGRSSSSSSSSSRYDLTCNCAQGFVTEERCQEAAGCSCQRRCYLAQQEISDTRIAIKITTTTCNEIAAAAAVSRPMQFQFAVFQSALRTVCKFVQYMKPVTCSNLLPNVARVLMITKFSCDVIMLYKSNAHKNIVLYQNNTKRMVKKRFTSPESGNKKEKVFEPSWLSPRETMSAESIKHTPSQQGVKISLTRVATSITKVVIFEQKIRAICTPATLLIC